MCQFPVVSRGYLCCVLFSLIFKFLSSKVYGIKSNIIQTNKETCDNRITPFSWQRGAVSGWLGYSSWIRWLTDLVSAFRTFPKCVLWLYRLTIVFPPFGKQRCPPEPRPLLSCTNHILNLLPPLPLAGEVLESRSTRSFSVFPYHLARGRLSANKHLGNVGRTMEEADWQGTVETTFPYCTDQVFRAYHLRSAWSSLRGSS